MPGATQPPPASAGHRDHPCDRVPAFIRTNDEKRQGWGFEAPKCREHPSMSTHSEQPRRGIQPLDEFAASLPPGARLVGIDVGTKTLGLSLSDATRTIATALVTLRRSRLTNDLHQLLSLVEERGVGGFVVGLPLNLDGSSGPRAQATRAFVRNLAKATPLPVLYWDERLSTVAAERTLLEADLSRKRRAEVVDKVAATLILQGALDRMGRLGSTRTS